jgi:hypothetical protein
MGLDILIDDLQYDIDQSELHQILKGDLRKIYKYQEWIETSKDWVSPDDGMFFVMAQGPGGSGAAITRETSIGGSSPDGIPIHASGGGSGQVAWGVFRFEKDDVVSCIIGAGGTSVTSSDNQTLDGEDGGITTFGTLLSAAGGTKGTAAVDAYATGGTGWMNASDAAPGIADKHFVLKPHPLSFENMRVAGGVYASSSYTPRYVTHGAPSLFSNGGDVSQGITDSSDPIEIYASAGTKGSGGGACAAARNFSEGTTTAHSGAGGPGLIFVMRVGD